MKMPFCPLTVIETTKPTFEDAPIFHIVEAESDIHCA